MAITQEKNCYLRVKKECLQCIKWQIDQILIIIEDEITFFKISPPFKLKTLSFIYGDYYVN